MYDGTGLDRISAKALRCAAVGIGSRPPRLDTENRVGEVPDAQNPLTRLQFLRAFPFCATTKEAASWLCCAKGTLTRRLP